MNIANSLSAVYSFKMVLTISQEALKDCLEKEVQKPIESLFIKAVLLAQILFYLYLILFLTQVELISLKEFV